MTSPTPGYARVIFRPNAEVLPHEINRRIFRPLAMTDHGDHVEWTDGKRTTKMRLPDQPDTGAGYPELHTLLVAAFKPSMSYAPGMITAYRIRYLDPDGRVIAWFGPGANTAVTYVKSMLPYPDAYQPLVDRGVQLQQALYDWEKQFYEDHPDPRIQGWSLSVARHPLALVLAFVAVIALIMWLVGAF